jgi:hypothetical protein
MSHTNQPDGAFCRLAVCIAILSTWPPMAMAVDPPPRVAPDLRELNELRKAADVQYTRVLEFYRAGNQAEAIAAATERLALERKIEPTDWFFARLQRPPMGRDSGLDEYDLVPQLISQDGRLHSDIASGLEMLARLLEAGGDYQAARAYLKELAAITSPPAQRPVLDDVRREIARLDRLAARDAEAHRSFVGARVATALIASSAGARGTAFCIDPSGLFVAHDSSLEGLWDESLSSFDYDEAMHHLSRVRNRPIQTTAQPVVLVLGADGPAEQSLPARVVRSSREHHLVLLKVDASRPLPYVALDPDSRPREGMIVQALGYPFVEPLRPTPRGAQVGFSASMGGVGDRRPRTIHWVWSDATRVRSIRETEGRPWLMVLDGEPPQGCTGGPVIDQNGRVAGLLVNGLESTNIHYVVPTASILAAFGRAIVLFDPPALTYSARKSPVNWTVRVLARDPLPSTAGVRVIVGTGAGQRVFEAEPVANRPQTYTVRVVAVVPGAPDQLDLHIVMPEGVATGRLADLPISVGAARLKLSELGVLELQASPRGFTRDGRPLAGAVLGLGEVTIGRGDQDRARRPVLEVATALHVTFPPTGIETVPIKILVLDGLDVLGELRTTVSVQEPPVVVAADVGPGRSQLGPRGASHQIRPPAIGEEPVMVEFNVRIGDVAVGGGGRYVLLTLPERSALAVFDVNAARVVKLLPLASGRALVTAGAEKAIVAYPDYRFIQRWDLASLELERSASLPIRGVLRAIELGADSVGPILAYWLQPQGKGEFDPTRLSLIDIASLEVLRLKPPDRGGQGQSGVSREPALQHATPGPGNVQVPPVEPATAVAADSSFDELVSQTCIPLDTFLGLARDLVHLRASTGGEFFSLWKTTGIPAGFMTIYLGADRYRRIHEHTGFGYLKPGPDGHTVFTQYGGLRDATAKPIGHNDRQENPSMRHSVGRCYLPSTSSAYYLGIGGMAFGARTGDAEPVAVRDQGRREPFSVTVHRAGGAVVMTLADVPEMVVSIESQDFIKHDFTIDKRFHLIPEADLLITVPPTNDRLVLRKLHLPAAPRGSTDGQAGSGNVPQPDEETP